jgi:carbamoyltransferase
MSLILGINCYHPNSSVCLVSNGKIVFFSEEERFNRIKNFSGFPELALQYIEKKYCNIDQVEAIVINSNPFSNILRKMYFSLHNFSFSFIAERFKNYQKKIYFNRFKKKKKYVEHHLSHIASSYYLSDFSECIGLSIDGFGDFSSLSLSINNNNNIKIKQRCFFPNSLGLFYHAMTQFIGFHNYGDEYKVMGMSAYGKPIYYERLKNIISFEKNNFYKINKKYFEFYKKNIFSINEKGMPEYQTLFSKNIEDLIGKSKKIDEPLSEKFFDLAASTQKVYEEIFFKILNNIYDDYKLKDLSLAGGCVMNALANGKIIEKTPFKRIFIPATPGDSGGSIGSSLYYYYGKYPYKKRVDNSSPFLGSQYENYDIEKIIDNFSEIFKRKKISISNENTEKINNIIAKKLSKGLIIALFRGRMENGPRALGNRSLIGDPRKKEISEKMNLIIKKREDFRPFAPSILEEFASEWYENYIPSPYMSFVSKIKKGKEKIVQAVTHADGTGRIQTVNKNINQDYYDLIKKFYEITSVPMILNTSLNDNEPIIESPENAINLFINNQIDTLLLENYLLTK